MALAATDRPAPRPATSEALCRRSPGPGQASCGTPAASAPRTLPAPPWCTTAVAWGSTRSSGTRSTTRTFGGRPSRRSFSGGRTSTISASTRAATATTAAIGPPPPGPGTVLRVTMIRAAIGRGQQPVRHVAAAGVGHRAHLPAGPRPDHARRRDGDRQLGGRHGHLLHRRARGDGGQQLRRGEQQVFLQHRRHADPAGGDRPDRGQRLVHDQVGLGALGQCDHLVGERGVGRAEQLADEGDPGPPGRSRGGR